MTMRAGGGRPNGRHVINLNGVRVTMEHSDRSLLASSNQQPLMCDRDVWSYNAACPTAELVVADAGDSSSGGGHFCREVRVPPKLPSADTAKNRLGADQRCDAVAHATVPHRMDMGGEAPPHDDGSPPKQTQLGDHVTSANVTHHPSHGLRRDCLRRFDATHRLVSVRGTKVRLIEVKARCVNDL